MPVIDVPSQSIQNIGQGASPPEIVEELWWYSGSYTSTSTPPVSAGSSFLSKGTTTPTSSQTTLFTLSPNWSASQKFAFEASIEEGTSGHPPNFALWDITSNLLVSSSQISITSQTMTVTRSSSFTLTPGHSYGVTLWQANNYPAYVTDASLIVFPS